jgi:hypothetical protein
MKSWLASPFRVAGTYLGGDNWACAYGNFSRSWVTQVAEQGWRFAPLWVGPQAPCTSVPGAVTIDPAHAWAEGKAQAASAVATAEGFGFGKGTPIYFDMEGYDNQDGSCSAAVLDFLSTWTQGLHAAGYKAGVYSSASSGMVDLASQYGRRGFYSPDDIWFADWNSDPVLSDGYVPGGDWTDNQRLHQFHGPNTERFGGVSVNIDDDYAGGAVAGLTASPGPYVFTQAASVAVVPGKAEEVQLVIGSTDGQDEPGDAVTWQVQAPAGLTVTPDQGTDTPAAGQPVTVSVQVAAGSSAQLGRYDLPVSASVDGQSITGTSELVSVVKPHSSLTTPRPVELYAADPASMASAVQVARDLALPDADVTGNYAAAWQAAADGHTLLLAVGQAAVNALYTNACGWSNPAHMGKGATPFTDLGAPLLQPPGPNYYEDSADGASTAQLTAQLTNYALTGTLPNQGQGQTVPSAPTGACVGSARIGVP